MNPNATKHKERTFVRGILAAAKRKRSKDEVENEKGELPSEGRHFDGEPPLRPQDAVPVSPTTEHSRSTLHANVDLEQPHWHETLWEDVRVGDYVKIRDKYVPPFYYLNFIKIRF